MRPSATPTHNIRRVGRSRPETAHFEGPRVPIRMHRAGHHALSGTGTASDTTRTTIRVSPNPVKAGLGVTMIVTVSDTFSPATIPQGGVTFTDSVGAQGGLSGWRFCGALEQRKGSGDHGPDCCRRAHDFRALCRGRQQLSRQHGPSEPHRAALACKEYPGPVPDNNDHRSAGGKSQKKGVFHAGCRGCRWSGILDRHEAGLHTLNKECPGDPVRWRLLRIRPAPRPNNHPGWES
jgi:hypothetical protein